MLTISPFKRTSNLCRRTVGFRFLSSDNNASTAPTVTDTKTYPSGLSGVSNESFVFSSPKVCVGNGIAAAAVTKAMHSLGIKNPLIISGAGGCSRLPKDLQAALLKTDLDVSPLAAHGEPHDHNFRGSTGNCVQINVKSEPTVNAVVAGTSVAIMQNCDGVVAVGGGSVLDAGKAISAMITNHGDIYDHLDAQGKGKELTCLPVPFISIPTVSGSGAEITSKSLLRCPKQDRTLALQHECMAPKVVIVDPQLALTAPARESAWSGFNALYQVIAGYIGDDRNPMVDSLGMEGIIRISRSLPVAFANGSDVRAREDLALGSVFCGLVHDNCKLGTIYGIANALGGYGGARGAICATLFPKIFEATMQKTERILKELKGKSNPSAADTREITYLTRMLHRTAYVAQVLTGNEDATAFDICDYLRKMKETLKIPSLKEIYEFPDDVDLRKIAERATVFSDTEGYTVELSADEVEAVLKELLK